MFTREFLVRARRRAMRRGVWYGSLDMLERGILSLAARVVDRVESVVLGVEIVKILGKLRDAMKGEFARHMEMFGYRRVKEIVEQAMKWGSNSARSWASDLGFVGYLTMIDMNQPTLFRM